MNLNKLTEEINKITVDQTNRLKDLVTKSSQIIIIGNGGSNAIASHIAIDYQKFLNKKVRTITDTGLLSMMVNDYGSDVIYSKFIEMNYEPNTLVILISSSGNSQNIIKAAVKADELDLDIISLSGFDVNNKLNTFTSKNVKFTYHVEDTSYGVVENCHQVFLHSIIEA